VGVPNEFFVGREKEVPEKKRNALEAFTYGYALTGHKAQGSQWGSVVVFDESFVFGESADRWLYTCLTRAADVVTVVRGKL
jgi:exodeoxyribonuclease-5